MHSAETTETYAGSVSHGKTRESGWIVCISQEMADSRHLFLGGEREGENEGIWMKERAGGERTLRVAFEDGF